MRRTGPTLALAGMLLAAASGALPADNLWIVTGDGYRDNYYIGLGALVPFPKSALGDGWVQRYWLDHFTYEYDGATRRIDATVYGAEAMIGYQSSRPGLSGALYLGARYADTTLRPDDPSNDARGSNVWPKLQAEGRTELGRDWHLAGIVSYIAGLDGYWARARLLRKVGSGLDLGPEAIVQGDPSYSAQKIGLVLGGIQVTPRTWLAVKAGYRFQSGANSPYAGLELVGLF